MHSFQIYSIYGRKQTSKSMHARVQYSHASVGLTQARPNLFQSIPFYFATGMHKFLPQYWS